MVEEQDERRARKQQEAKENRRRKELKRKLKVEEAQRASGVHARQAPPSPGPRPVPTSGKVPPRWPPPPPSPPQQPPLTLHRLRLLDRLGLVARDDNPVAIRSAHRRLVLLWHPDKNPDPKAGEVFKAIQAAYEELIGR